VIWDIAASYIELQARAASRKADRLFSLLLLKLAAGILTLIALGVLLAAMFMALAVVMHPAAALAIVGLLIAIFAGVAALFAVSVAQRR
jgi:hypothetical protein